MILSNQIKCLKCGDEPYSAHVHDMRHCKCGSVFVDGGTRYRRVGGDLQNMVDLSIVWSDEKAAYVTREIETAISTGRNAFGILCAVARAMRDWDRGIDVDGDGC